MAISIHRRAEIPLGIAFRTVDRFFKRPLHNDQPEAFVQTQRTVDIALRIAKVPVKVVLEGLFKLGDTCFTLFRGNFLFRAALIGLIFLLGLAFPLNVPAQESKGMVAEQKTDRPACDEAGNDHASQVGIGKPVGNRDGRINRVHFVPPLWIVIGASLAFGVIVGIIAGGIAFNVIAFILDFKERKK